MIVFDGVVSKVALKIKNEEPRVVLEVWPENYNPETVKEFSQILNKTRTFRIEPLSTNLEDLPLGKAALQVKSSEAPKAEPPLETLDRTEWILKNSCSDINYRTTVPELTDEELIYCLKHEKRTTGLKLLVAEARKRGIPWEATVFQGA